ncbi:hypothetical protein D3C72_938590 [compost metagenome]
MHDHPVSEIGEGATRIVIVFQQHDFRQALLTHQFGGHALKHQRQEIQAAGESRRHVRLDHGGATQKLETAGFELAWVHPEKLIIPTPGQQPPKPRIGGGRDANLGIVQLRRIDADLAQHLFGGCTRRATLQQRFTRQLDGDGVFFRH